ncbi:unnamed protein product, partial [Arabidopsis halleri]
FLLPTSHHPKISKEHAEMSENLTFFLSYPWGRVSFEMMMASIKERELEQLATASVAVQGLLYALQLVVLHSVLAIQEGPVLEETVGSESEEEAEIENSSRQVVPFKLGNAKELDKKCQTHVQPIIFPEVENEADEDFSWSDEEEDLRVDTLVKLAEQGFKFNNDMFPGGCIPSQISIAPKKQKRGAKVKGGRVRKHAKESRNPTGVRRAQNSGAVDEDGGHGPIDMIALSRMFDDKLAASEKRIINAVTYWFMKNTISAEQGGSDPKAGDRTVANSDDVEIIPSRSAATCRKNRGVQHPKPLGEADAVNLGFDASVEEVVAFYNGSSPCDDNGVVSMDVDPLTRNQEEVYVGNQQVNAVAACTGNDLDLVANNQHTPTDDIVKQSGLPEINEEALHTEKGSCGDIEKGEVLSQIVGNTKEIDNPEDDVAPQTVDNTKEMDNPEVNEPHVTTGVVAEVNSEGDVGPQTVDNTKEIDNPKVNEPHVTTGVVAEVNSESGGSVNSSSSVGVIEDSQTQADDPTEGNSDKYIHSDVPSLTPLSCAAEPLPTPKEVASQSSVVAVPPWRRSKRLRTISTKLDGRFQFDKKTKGLVGHPSPANIPKPPVSPIDPEERFNNSMKKLKVISSVSLGGEVSLASKDILELVDRKKPMANKVMDALLKFSRHLLRTDDVDGEKLHVDVLDTKFVSQLCRLYPKYSKAPSPLEFQFPSVLIDIVSAAGVEDRAQLYSEVDYLYLPFNFEKKHWVALVVDLNYRKITVLDCNVHLRTDKTIKLDLQPLADMLPVLFKQAAANPEMSQLLTSPFTIERSLCIPQVASSVDSGLMSIFLIHAHATGGME